MKFLLWLIPVLFNPSNSMAEEAEKAAKLQPLRQNSALHTNTKEYIHSWQSFPSITGYRVQSNEKVSLKAEKGRALVVIFLASWCLPCQQLIKEFKSMEKKFSQRYTDFLYVFAHDTRADALGFTKAYKMGANTLLADIQLMKSFKQPRLPSIYVSDRQTWMIWRSLEVKKKDLANLDEFLEYHTAN